MPSIKIYSKEQVDDLISGVTPPTVVQTTGTSTTSVMSQNAVTTALGNKADTSALPTSSQLVPSTSGASSGDVLSFNGTSTEWVAPSGGGGHTTISVTVSNLYTTLNGLASGTNFIIRAHKFTNTAKYLLMEVYGNRDNMSVGSSATDYYVCGTMTRYYSTNMGGTVRLMETANQAKWIIYYTSGTGNGSFNIGESATTHELISTDYVEIEYW